MSENLNNSEIREDEHKKEIYREIIGLNEGENPDMILVLDAGISERKKLGETKWGPTSHEDETGNFPKNEKSSTKYNLRTTSHGNSVIGCGGGKARALAGIELGGVFGATIVTDSRYPVKVENGEEPPPEDHSQVYKEYLERMGVPKDKIQEEKESTTTFEGLINFLIMASENQSNHPVIITNGYHLPRTEKMLELLLDPEKAKSKLKYLIAKLPAEYLERIGAKVEGEGKDIEVSFVDSKFLENTNKLSVKVASAEDILVHRDPRYGKLFDKVKETEEYQKRVKLEESGVRQLEEGIYGMPKN
jgi:hypothetical protein